MPIKELKRIWSRWDFQREPAQVPPTGAWHSWLFLGGRGAGKTLAGALWLRSRVERGARCALVGPTLHDVREVMIEGPSGLKAVSPKGNRPRYEVSRRRLLWPDGGVAYAFSADEPERLRGPQFHAAWADEFCAWKHPQTALSNLRMGLRLGGDPRLVITTTPRPTRALKTLIAEPGVVVTRAATADNRVLSIGFVERLLGLYGGTRLAAQELEGLVVDQDGSALWRADDLSRCYGARPGRFDAVVVAVDPPGGHRGDACGIVVAGRLDRRGYVLEDASLRGQSPMGWARRAVEMVVRYGASQVVAEANIGGDMVRTVLVQAGCRAPIELVHARDGKRVRAEPVAALYEQGRVSHCPEVAGTRFAELDEELMALGTADMVRSPDRADALVWALTMLLIRDGEGPRVRRL